jgi:hypothetical protein
MHGESGTFACAETEACRSRLKRIADVVSAALERSLGLAGEQETPLGWPPSRLEARGVHQHPRGSEAQHRLRSSEPVETGSVHTH